ncbi:RBD and RhoGEF domain containing protein [Trichuris trichiura]|uniref:RBD and RhoGEF domain containing protein n=1 Tax=Trichuris trichiura TaxID=36087 RepID=A0A077YUL1_TRITR|nr:RBD and RhoGEF domain containing protein [Trichuris trichiura]
MDFVRHFHKATNCANGSDDSDGSCCETLVAIKGVTLKDALAGLTKKYQFNIERINIFLKSSNTPLPLETDTSFLGGLKVFLRSKEVTTLSSKSNASNTLPNNSNTSCFTKPDLSWKQERKLSFGTVSKRKGEKLLLINDSTGGNGEKQEMLNEGSAVHSAAMSGMDSVSGRKERTRSYGRLSQIFPNPFKVVDRADMLDSLMQWQEEGLKTAASFLQESNSPTGCQVLFLEDHWQTIVKSGEQLSRKQQKQQEGIWELITTELEYICKLGSIVELQSCIRTLQQDGLGAELDVETVFSNISEICRANLGFWLCCVHPLLQYSRQTGKPLDPTKMESGFSRLDYLFRPYIPYCLAHVDVLCYIRQKLKESDFFRDLIVWIQSRKAFGRLHLTDLLAKPMQRLTKYPLLLKAVLNNSTDTADVKSLRVMIEKAEEFASRVNVELCFKQHYDTLCSIMQCIDSYEVVDSANDELEKLVKEFALVDLTSPMPGCRQGLLRRHLIRGELKLRESYTKTDVICFLFTDMFLVCKQIARKGDRPRVKVIRPPYHIENIIVKQLRETNGFMFVQMNEFRVPAYACVFLTGTLEETYRWLENFQIAKEEYSYLSAYDYPSLIGYADEFGTERGYPLRYMVPIGGEPPGGSNTIRHRKGDGAKASALKRLTDAKSDRVIPFRRTSMGAVDYRSESASSTLDINHRKCNSMDTTSSSSRKSFERESRSSEQPSTVDTHKEERFLKPMLPNHERETAPQRSPFSLPNFFPVHRMFPMEMLPKEHSEQAGQSIKIIESQAGATTSGSNYTGEEGHLSPSSRRLERRYHTADGIEVLKPSSQSTNILKRFSWNTAASASRARSGTHHPSCRKASSSTVSSDSCYSSSGISSSSSHLYYSYSENELAESAGLRGVIRGRKLSFAPPAEGPAVDELIDDVSPLTLQAGQPAVVEVDKAMNISSFHVTDSSDAAVSLSHSPASCSSNSSTICASVSNDSSSIENQTVEISNTASHFEPPTTAAMWPEGSKSPSKTADSVSLVAKEDAAAQATTARRHNRHREDLFKIIHKGHLESS